jgi:hypothetical protein
MLRSKTIVPFLLLTALNLLAAGKEEKDQTPAYDLTVSIEPVSGNIAVRGSVEVPLAEPAAKTFRFSLHETFAISKLLVDGKQAAFTYAPPDAQIPLPASRSVVVTLPRGMDQSRIRMDIAYGGRLKALPEFGASPDMRHSLDDQVNARMIELTGFASWYPQFAFGRPLRLELALSLPPHWIPICSGRRLEDRVNGGRTFTR